MTRNELWVQNPIVIINKTLRIERLIVIIIFIGLQTGHNQFTVVVMCFSSGKMNTFFLTEQALKYPNAPFVIFDTGLDGEVERPASLFAVLKYSKTP